MNNNNLPPKEPIHYSLGTNVITIIHENKPMEITSDMVNYVPLLQALKDQDWDTIPDLLDETSMLATMTRGRISARNGKVFFDNEELHSAEAKKLNDLVQGGFEDKASRFIKFMEKQRENPSYHCRTQSYNFIAHQGMPLTADGNIVGYKGVRDDYMDRHSGTFDNSIGKEHSMLRTGVDDNPNNGCSNGFHIGSFDYADSWAGSEGRLMLVEYSPKDIVSVPEEHGFGKLRVCRYKVIGECTSRKILNDGAYGFDSERSQDIYDYLTDGPFGYGYGLWFKDIQQQFPNVSMVELNDAVEEHRTDPNEIFTRTFESHQNDWQIGIDNLES